MEEFLSKAWLVTSARFGTCIEMLPKYRVNVHSRAPPSRSGQRIPAFVVVTPCPERELENVKIYYQKQDAVLLRCAQRELKEIEWNREPQWHSQ